MTQKEQIIREILQKLNGMPYGKALLILDEVKDRVQGSLKISFSEDELTLSDTFPNTHQQEH